MTGPSLRKNEFGVLPIQEILTPSQYLGDLERHLAALPDIPIGTPMYSSDAAKVRRLSRFSSSNSLAEEGATSLFRQDLIDPSFCWSTEALIQVVVGTEPPWYAENRYGRKNTYYDKSAAFEWDLFFVNYMKQRRSFHITLMRSLLEENPFPSNLQTAGIDILALPSLPNYHHQDASTGASEKLYSADEWLSASLLSILQLPPTHCDARMKRKAIENCAQYIANPTTYSNYTLPKILPAHRLPWSMRSSTEWHSTYHPDWGHNPMVKDFFARIGGLQALLEQRPKDYIQVLILATFTYSGFFSKLLETAKLPDQVKDIIFSSDASFNTIFSAEPILENYNMAPSLAELLEGRMTEETAKVLVEGQRLRIHALEDALAQAQETAGRQQRYIDQLLEQARQQDAIIQQQSPHLPRSQADLTMLAYGLTPALNGQPLLAAVSGLRQHYNKMLQAHDAPPEAEQRLKIINAELDDILRARGLHKNQR